ncbi:DNA damage-inducible protein DinB [Bacillus sp. J14TS2]|uniref:DinB family protein n=1 Tax=Bacillus sp. J14TS2 TaxID=2807188 RepID=UPI001B0F847C|nr:DinB family protein [Bacillus sp. J14TS2]GIN73144.1 DNA damage-inducible protein DinB [Bacillus sp. J14TS2]
MAISKEEFMEILEGNRKLTIRIIEAFPEERLFQYKPVEPLRPFSEMVIEILNIEKAYMRGIALDEWEYSNAYEGVLTKEELLTACKDVRKQTQELWPSVTEETLSIKKKDPFFGGQQTHIERLQYALENEIHHRGQGYIYLRMLSIEPPAFYDR